MSAVSTVKRKSSKVYLTSRISIPKWFIVSPFAIFEVWFPCQEVRKLRVYSFRNFCNAMNINTTVSFDRISGDIINAPHSFQRNANAETGNLVISIWCCHNDVCTELGLVTAKERWCGYDELLLSLLHSNCAVLDYTESFCMVWCAFDHHSATWFQTWGHS